MVDNGKHISEVFKALRSLVNRSFPLECSCGRTYYTLEEFLAETEKPVEKEHGLFEPTEYDDRSITNLLRNCPACGSTLMAVFSERRDVSARGDEARELFDQILAAVQKDGISRDVGRKELRALLRGEDSPLLREKLESTSQGALQSLAELLGPSEK